MPSAVSTRAATRWWPRALMCRRSSDQYAAVDSSRSGQLNARTMSGRSANVARDGRGEQVAAALEDAAERKLPRRVGAREHDELHALLVAALEHVREGVDDARDARPRPEHVVAAAVERQVRRLQCERRLELLVDDRPDEPAADREVGVLDRLGRSRPPSPARRDPPSPRTRPSGSSSPTPSVKESPMATKRTDATSPAYGGHRSSSASPRRSTRPHARGRGDGEERREHDEQQRARRRRPSSSGTVSGATIEAMRPTPGRPARAGRAQRRRVHLGGDGVQRAPRAEVEERQRHAGGDDRRPRPSAVPKKTAATAEPTRNTERVSRRPHTSMSHAATA